MAKEIEGAAMLTDVLREAQSEPGTKSSPLHPQEPDLISTCRGSMGRERDRKPHWCLRW